MLVDTGTVEGICGWVRIVFTVGVSLVRTGETINEGAIEVVAAEIGLEGMVVDTTMVSVKV